MSGSSWYEAGDGPSERHNTSCLIVGTIGRARFRRLLDERNKARQVAAAEKAAAKAAAAAAAAAETQTETSGGDKTALQSTSTTKEKEVHAYLRFLTSARTSAIDLSGFWSSEGVNGYSGGCVIFLVKSKAMYASIVEAVTYCSYRPKCFPLRLLIAGSGQRINASLCFQNARRGDGHG